MARKKLRISSGFVFFGLLLAGNILLFMPQEKTKKINFFFMRQSAPVLNAVPKPKPPAEKIAIPASKYNELVLMFNKLVAQMEVMRNENENLTRIRNDFKEPGAKLVMAKVFRTTLDGQRNELLINQGSTRRIKKGQYVISASKTSVIGTIKDVSKNMARVQLFTDSNHHLPVFISRTNNISNKKLDVMMGTLNGTNKKSGKIPLIPKDKDIQIDDSVFAAVRPGYIDTPLQIGTITAVKLDDNSPTVWDIKVEPLIDFETIEDVAVIVVDTKELDSQED